MFKDKYHPQVKKDLKKLDRSVRAEIQNTHIQQILNSPSTSDILYGFTMFIHTILERAKLKTVFLIWLMN